MNLDEYNKTTNNFGNEKLTYGFVAGFFVGVAIGVLVMKALMVVG